MQRIHWSFAVVFAFVLAGCASDEVTSPETSGPTGTELGGADRAAIEADIASQPEIFDGQAFELAGEDELDGAAYGGVTFDPEQDPGNDLPESPIPHFFRRIQFRDRTIVIVREERDSIETARVRITTRLAGTFNIVVGDRDPSLSLRDHRNLIIKRLRDVGHRQAIYHRALPGEGEGDMDALGTTSEGDANADRRGWYLAAISNRRVASPDHTTAIQSIALKAESGLSVEITDPLELRRYPRALPKVVAGEVVHIRVQTSDADDPVVLLTRWGRRPLRRVEPGVWETAIRAPDRRGLFHIGVNAIDHETLFNPAAPYDSDYWGILMGALAPESDTAIVE